jgi:hypothetical protein
MAIVGAPIGLSRILPTIQLALTATLTIWADRVDLLHLYRLPPSLAHVHLFVFNLRRMWTGVNAPTFPFYFASGPTPTGFELLGLNVGEILYLIAVAVLWYLVGRLFDRLRGVRQDGLGDKLRIFTSVLVLVWAGFLLVFGILVFPNFFPATFDSGRVVRPDALVTYVLHLFWALALIAFSVWELVRGIRPTNTPSRNATIGCG